MKEYKLLFTGPAGAGKTTAIAAISEVPPVVTDVMNTDDSVDKELTTVGLDFGEITLDNGDKLRLFGTPGQVRFAFMWNILSQGAMGLIILLNAAGRDPIADVKNYVQSFGKLIRDSACVVGVGRSEQAASVSINELSLALQSCGVMCPIVPVDVRERSHVLMLIDLLLMQLEHKQ